MDVAASLHDRLRTRLDHLEAKLEAHRQELLDEFHQHYHQLTRTADPSAVVTMQHQLRTTLDHYKTLRPSLPATNPPLPHPPQPAAAPAAESPPRPPVSDNPETATTSQTLSLASTPADSGNLVAPGSPRDRDHELQGLFTPSYLPLLADSDVAADSIPAVTTTAAAISSQQPSVVAGSPNSADNGWMPATENLIANSTTSAEMNQSADENRFPGGLTTPPRHRPRESEPAEAATADDANSSASSDKGDNKGPRSALRRYSSIYKSPQSPRRVRFEFMGAEVLPTASPQPGDTMMPSLPSPMWEGENVTVDSVLGGDADDLEPPPFKKISSSDALRALSREPLEDGTVWTVVNPDSDNVVTNQMQQVDLGKPLASTEPGMQQIRQDTGNDTNAPDSSFLDLKKTRVATPPPLNKAPANASDVGDDGDDMFEFEDEGGKTLSSWPPPSPADEDEQSEDETAADVAASFDELSTLRSPTTVAPAPMPKPKAEAPAPATPTTPRFHVGSVGSYKGRSIMMPVVKDPEVHAKAASIGIFNSFVGGVDGTSGMDAADLSSYRASFMRDTFSGTPRSFTERLMMEDMEADRLKEKPNEQ
ncbi:hypothetical protein A9K55_006274 [Cordyceps militaris]|uniref:Uncharacterized protein n=1 Tax=Cordyceps militaris TaxID=73501 RepID=A0A2H4SC20_CORMI|nr:hypothetical protein A9K55_006274 [Cordyceps militaris]